MISYFAHLATLGDWSFYEVTDHGFNGELANKPMYAFTTTRTREAEPKVGEYYETIEHAMASAIAAKYTGPRGAGGTGVGTAADWFMRSIGAFSLTRAELIEKAATSDHLAREIHTGPDINDLRDIAAAVIDSVGLGRRP